MLGPLSNAKYWHNAPEEARVLAKVRKRKQIVAEDCWSGKLL